MGKPAGNMQEMTLKDALNIVRKKRDTNIEFFLGYLKGMNANVKVVAVQPRWTDYGKCISAECLNSLDEVREWVIHLIQKEIE